MRCRPAAYQEEEQLATLKHWIDEEREDILATKVEDWLKAVTNAGIREELTTGLVARVAAVQDAGWLPSPDTVETDSRLLIFDFDGTITTHDGEDYGLSGSRLERLQAMAEAIKDCEARFVIITAQQPSTTEEVTIPLLMESGLAVLFDERPEGDIPTPCTYWEDASRGTIYNGEAAMTNKVRLIRKIIRGMNCWRISFRPSAVLFLDDDERNFRGHGDTHINIRLIGPAGMDDEDCKHVEEFASQAL
eukprot:TRINITY_DN13413_c0_g1_i6.p2 TRINITY_DN13413_c0_g1~~TRINITY_DN13413_c0_g1_i6.p2  ORF type:complete len:248 (-),score=49.54 TRINITY_DN13413_c0_g1_i6:581-1324(-)